MHSSHTGTSEGLGQFLLASELASQGRYDEAEAAFANAVLLTPDLHLARYQLGLLQFSTGRAAAALVSWQPLLALDDTSPLPHFVKGFAALSQDDAAAARAHFEAGLARNSGNEALSGDIRKVLDRMDAAQAVAARAPASAGAEPAANHILIANYGRVGTLH